MNTGIEISPVIKNEEQQMIQNVFKLDDILIGQICTHRMDIVCLEIEDTVEEWEKVIFESRHSFYPICEETKDEIIGKAYFTYYPFSRFGSLYQ